MNKISLHNKKKFMEVVTMVHQNLFYKSFVKIVEWHKKYASAE